MTMAKWLQCAWPRALLSLLLIGEGQAIITISAQSPLNYRVGENIIISIAYSSSSSSAPTIQWTKDSKTIVSFGNNISDISDAYKTRLTIDSTGSINISIAASSDTGVYGVSVSALGEIPGTKAVQVNVYEPIGTVSVSSTPSEVSEDDPSVELDCRVTSGTAKTITWTKDGRDVGPSYTVSGTTLTITKPSRTDSGQFTCHILNPFSNGSGSFNLSVYYGPQISAIIVTSDTLPYSQQYVQAHSNVNLTCYGESYPLAQYSWVLSSSSGASVPTGPILNISDIKLTQAGRYNCLARNSKTDKTVQMPIVIDVYEFPQGGPSCTMESVNGNSALRFLCSWPSGSPRPTLSFSGLPGSTLSQFLLEQNVTSMGGLSGKVITCVGTYQVPSLNRNCSITPEAPEVFNFSMQATADAWDAVSVDLRFRGKFNPGAVEWYGPASKPLSSGGRYNISEGTTRLTISNFTLEGDLGNYSFSCQNPLGEKSQALKLTAPSVSSLTVTRSSDGLSATLAWTIPPGAIITSLQVQMQGSPLARATTGEWATIRNVSSATGSYVVSGLQPSESYSFRVVPMFGSRPGASLDAQTVTPSVLSSGAIAGIVVGSVLGALLIILLLVLLVCCIRKRKGQKGRTPPPPKQSLKKIPADKKDSVGKAVWNRASVSSSTLTGQPAFYNTHNAMFRSTSISTISATMPANSPAANTNVRSATQV